ncbi:DEKNAAC100042 [Brettanomyces naardenensis]|uniref:Protein BCP1 n=1 Tax=Brettanomyces naardenensis TaxID=13370 RepID=A0A448YGG9_BRENA|nr:DEKNAAC100042 [Brettanomyces naardenensis]
MAKRTQEDVVREDEESDSDIELSSTDDEALKEESDEDMINVDFDFFNLDPTVDFAATKNLLRQLFQQDSVIFPLSQLADLLLTNKVGTSVKTDGMQGDLFSILSIAGLTDNLSNEGVKALTKYVLERTANTPKFNGVLQQLLSPSSTRKLGLIFSERLINMPVQTVPPMYRMLLEEIEKADLDYNYDYFLIPSRVYQMLDSEVDKELEDDDDSNGGVSSKKRSKKNKQEIPELEYYHFEDEVLEKRALHHEIFDYTKKGVDPDARRVFNDYAVVPKLSLILISKDSLRKATEEMSEKFAP